MPLLASIVERKYCQGRITRGLVGLVKRRASNTILKVSLVLVLMGFRTCGDTSGVTTQTPEPPPPAGPNWTIWYGSRNSNDDLTLGTGGAESWTNTFKLDVDFNVAKRHVNDFYVPTGKEPGSILDGSSLANLRQSLKDYLDKWTTTNNAIHPQGDADYIDVDAIMNNERTISLLFGVPFFDCSGAGSADAYGITLPLAFTGVVGYRRVAVSFVFVSDILSSFTINQGDMLQFMEMHELAHARMGSGDINEHTAHCPLPTTKCWMKIPSSNEFPYAWGFCLRHTKILKDYSYAIKPTYDQTIYTTDCSIDVYK